MIHVSHWPWSFRLPLLLAFFGVLVPIGITFAGFGYAKVADEDVLSLQFNHYFSSDRKHHDADFEWSFTKSGFEMKEAKGPIAEYLRKSLAPDAKEVKAVSGKWKLVAKAGGGQVLVLTEIQADGKPGAKEVELPIYRTAPTVIRIGNPQHVFGLK